MYKNLAQFFLDRTEFYNDGIAHVEPVDDGYKKYTYGDFREDVLKLSGYLLKAGIIDDNSKIALLAENSHYWTVVYFTAHFLGIPVVPLDTKLHASDNIHFLRHSKADILFTDSKIYDGLNLEIRSGLNIKEAIVTDTSRPYNGEKSLKNILKNETNIKGIDNYPGLEKRDKNDLAAILYTSGTTGSPKGVSLTHGNLLHQIDAIPSIIKFKKDDVFVAILPLFHAFPAAGTMLIPLAVGSKVVFSNTLRATKIVRYMKDQKVTVMLGVPALFDSFKNAINRKVKNSSILKRVIFTTFKGVNKVLNKVNINAGSAVFKNVRQKAGLSTLRLMVSGGAPLVPSTGDFFDMLGIEFVQGYGLTETAPVLTVNYRVPAGLESVGKPIDGVKLRIKNKNEKGYGEIEAKGDNVMSGYFKNDRATRKVMDNGWLKTGDIGYIDDNNCLYIKGRSKNVIVTAAGKNVYPEEIEAKLQHSDYISEAMVYGKEMDNKNEKVAALIYPDHENLDKYFSEKKVEESKESIYNIINQEIKKYTENLPAFKKVKYFKIQQEEFQKTTTRKIKRYLYTDR
ncbi:MAG: AMP-dependent synthetase/ligase [Elusimicrobiota bacterium]